VYIFATYGEGYQPIFLYAKRNNLPIFIYFLIGIAHVTPYLGQGYIGRCYFGLTNMKRGKRKRE
jgi:hypothetical protein